MLQKLHEQLVNKEKSCLHLTKEYLQKIKEFDQELGAYLSVHADESLIEAKKKDDASVTDRGPLWGIPCAIKDNICVLGEKTTAGSKILENYISPYDATVVSRLKKAGVIILGKTNMDEFAMGSSTENSAYHITKNPYDATRVAGGTSGGSAAAVSAGLAPFALGSDTGGSIRQPAAFCGVVGFKPTYGRVSRHGLIAAASSLDQIGTITHSVEDAAIILSVIAGEDVMDSTCAPLPEGKSFLDGINDSIAGIKIGVPKEYFPEDLDNEIRVILEARLDALKEKGAEIIPISLPHAKYALPTYYIIQPAEVSSNLARFDGMRYGKRNIPHEASDKSPLIETYFESRGQNLGKEVKRRIMLGTYALSSGYYDAFYQKAQKVRSLLRRDFENAFKTVDVIFSPTTPDVAFKIGEKEDPLSMYLSDIYTITANLVGVPALSVPIGTKTVGGKALPLGGQFMAKWFDEETLFRVANYLEKIVKE